MSRSADVLMPASAQDRLDRIAEVLHKEVDSSGGTTGDCNECGWMWPCPTYRWATEPVDTISILCTWDLEDCSFEEHKQHAPSDPSQTSADVDAQPAASLVESSAHADPE